MKKQLLFTGIVFILISIFVIPNFLDAKTKGVKTSYKRYSIFNFKNEDVLCEPYTVTKDDWLYKIFRKKGEISEKDFPQFLIIFKDLNPQISNIDAIEPGIRILIPLKKIKKQDYEQSTPGTIDVPIIEFSTTPEDFDLKPFIKPHKIKKGETISNLIDKDFLKKGGSLSQEGIKAFQMANPNIKNINIIYEGAQVYLPDPSIKSEPWFKSLFSAKSSSPEMLTEKAKNRQKKIEAHELAQLKKYASLIGGTLLNQGKIYFPGSDNSKTTIDLSTTPMIEMVDGSKILIISGNTSNSALLENIQNHWQNLKTQALSESMRKLKEETQVHPRINQTIEYQKMIADIISQTSFEYIPDAKIPFIFNNIQLEAPFSRIVRKETTDLLINFGHVYGAAIAVLEKREFEIISITPKLTIPEAINTLFSHLGYSTWENPAFYTGKTIETIKGIYAVKKDEKLFVSMAPLSTNAVKYLEKENIKRLSLNSDIISK
ncbi:MAG: hypothetical protein L3J69_08275 [Desulfobacula sp.]|nr:hypothetical protein [Desulfobacula sp.]